MRKSSAFYTLLLFITAVIWGFAFVAQRKGMESMGPFAFNAVRFALGGFSLWLLRPLFRKDTGLLKERRTVYHGIILGIVLFAGASLQQLGMTSTTAGNAGFITSLYIILVPLFGHFTGRPSGRMLWLASLLAISGIYLLSFKGSYEVHSGDFWVLLSAIFWAVHVLLISQFTLRINPLDLAIIQFLICSLLSSLFVLIFEKVSTAMLVDGYIPLLYGGLLSVGVAYTLQLVAQKYVHPTFATVILGTESLFAVLGGWWLLNEYLLLPGIIGCIMLFTATIIAQLGLKENPQKQQMSKT